MPSLKRLRGVAHDVADHSQGTFGWLHPHLATACRLEGVLEARLELLVPEPYPDNLPRLEPLRLASRALRDWFVDLLSRLGYEPAIATSVVLTFYFRSNDDYNPAVRATIKTQCGKEYTGAVDHM